VFFAIRNALKAAREQNGHRDYFLLQLPATSERIRLACADSHVERLIPLTPEPANSA